MVEQIHPEYRRKLLQLATRASVTTAILLIVVKLFGWFMSGSISMMATTIDSILDVFASVINLVAVNLAMKPADDDHHFGHSKVQSLAVLIQSIFIAGSAVFLIVHAITQSIATPVENVSIASNVMIFSIVCTLILFSIQRYVIKKTQSIVIKVDELHYRMDLFINVAVLVAVQLSGYGFHFIDSILGVLIALYMLHSVRSVGWDAIKTLMDTALSEEDLKVITEIILSTDGVYGIHELRTRISDAPIIQFHIDVPSHLTIEEAHEIGSDAKAKVLKYIANADVTFHLDPVKIDAR